MNQHTVPRTCPNCKRKDQEIARLTAERDAAEFDRVWRVYKREGLERRMPHLRSGMAVVVVDLDRMKEANARFGHAGVDSRMTKIFQATRTDDTFAGRWKQGDEVAVFVHQDDAIGLANRLLGAFLALDLSATIAVVGGASHAHVDLGIARIEQAKADNERGRIFVVEGGMA